MIGKQPEATESPLAWNRVGNQPREKIGNRFLEAPTSTHSEASWSKHQSISVPMIDTFLKRWRS